MGTTKDIDTIVTELLVVKGNPIFQLSLAAKELFHSNFLYWIASRYPKLFNEVMKKLGVNIELSEESEKNIIEREYNHFDFCVCVLEQKKRKNSIEKKKISFVLENKFKSIPYIAQLEKYDNQIKKINGVKVGEELNIPRVLLTLATEFDGYDAKEKDNVNGWKVITYSDYIKAIRDVLSEYNLDTFGKELIDRYCSFVETIATGFNSMLNKALSWKQMLDVSKELEDIRLHDVWQKLYASKVFTQLENYTPIPEKDFSVMMKKVNNKEIIITAGNIYKELSYGTSGAYISVAIPVKVDDLWLCIIIQVQGHDYRIGFVAEKNFIVKKGQENKFADIIQPFTFLLKETSIKGKIGNKEDISNLETYCVFNSDYPFYYRKWANDDKLSDDNKMAEVLRNDIEAIKKNINIQNTIINI